MIILLTILQNAVQSVVDIFDKFLITKRKIEPVNYTFYTVVTGALILTLWPWFFEPLPAKFILLDLLAGMIFSLAYYTLFRAISYGEVSRVVPFVFGLLPVFDLILSSITGRNVVTATEFVGICLLISGALLITYHPGKYSYKHILIKILAALLLSSYNLLWQYGAQGGQIMNSLMWNRLGAAGVLIIFLLVPGFRNKVFAIQHIPKKIHTSFLFFFKQFLGGFNFIFLSYLLALGNVIIVDSLQGFRYAFLFVMGLVLAKKYRHILDEDTNRRIILQKASAISLIFAGTIFLFLK